LNIRGWFRGEFLGPKEAYCLGYNSKSEYKAQMRYLVWALICTERLNYTLVKIFLTTQQNIEYFTVYENGEDF
jgi:hypothetical protein